MEAFLPSDSVTSRNSLEQRFLRREQNVLLHTPSRQHHGGARSPRVVAKGGAFCDALSRSC
eukprot:3796528-Prymnesium_polylepis.1